MWDDKLMLTGLLHSCFTFYPCFAKKLFPLTFITVIAFVPILAVLAIFPWEAHPANCPRSPRCTRRAGRPGGTRQAARQLGALLQRCLGKAPEDVVGHAGHSPEEEDGRNHGTAWRKEMGAWLMRAATRVWVQHGALCQGSVKMEHK